MPTRPPGQCPPPPTAPSRPLLPLTHGTRALARAFLGDFPAAEQDVAATMRFAETTGRGYDRLFALTVGGIAALQPRRADAPEASFRSGRRRHGTRADTPPT